MLYILTYRTFLPILILFVVTRNYIREFEAPCSLLYTWSCGCWSRPAVRWEEVKQVEPDSDCRVYFRVGYSLFTLRVTQCPTSRTSQFYLHFFIAPSSFRGNPYTRSIPIEKDFSRSRYFFLFIHFFIYSLHLEESRREFLTIRWIKTRESCWSS